jgi:predicted CXXCH cytochrome family protein
MNHPEPSQSGIANAWTFPRRHRRAVILLAVIATGCSIEKNYKLLSFFFDGVPDPTLVASGADAVRFARETGGVVFTHLPYAQEQCAECHTDPAGENLTKVDNRVCLKCHAGVNDEYPQMHGPVAAVACLMCHAPHESTVKPLLRTAGPSLCTQCHGPRFMGTPTSPVHADMQRDCLDCHRGHGGAARYFLHDEPAMPAIAPAR